MTRREKFQAMALALIYLIQEAPEEDTVEMVERLQEDKPEWARFVKDFVVNAGVEVAKELKRSGDL